MEMTSRWRLNGRSADARELAETLALARQHQRKLAQAERDARDQDAQARAVGRAIRRALYEQARSRLSIGCRPARVGGRRQGRVRLRRFETMAGLLHPKRYSGVPGRPSSFHCKFTGRGLGQRRRAKDRPYKRGEAVRAVRYILRDAAREITDGGVVSSIGCDPDEIAGVFAAIEELEATAGRDNANVYMSLVVSLPHELDGPQREALLARICEPLAEHNLPYAGVLHSPDPNGDARNYHAHVIYSWRPFRRKVDGSFSFSAVTWAELNGTPFITEVRARAADAMNEAMANAGHARRFTPLSKAGLEGKPNDPKRGKSAAGRKHAERRRENINLGLAERGWIEERRAARARLAEVAMNITVRTIDDRQARLAALGQVEARITAARLNPPPRPIREPVAAPAEPPVVVVTPQPVVPTRPPSIPEPSPPTGRPAERSVASVARDERVSEPPRTEDAARQAGRASQSEPVSREKPKAGIAAAGAPRSVDPQAQASQALPPQGEPAKVRSAPDRIARDEARRRAEARNAAGRGHSAHTTQPVSSSSAVLNEAPSIPPTNAEAIRAADEWSHELSPERATDSTSDRSDQTPETVKTHAAGIIEVGSGPASTPEQERERRLRKTLARLRRSSTYERLSPHNQQQLDQQLSALWPHIVQGATLMSVYDDRLRVCSATDRARKIVYAVAAEPVGWSFLVAVARAMQDLMPDDAGRSWQIMEKPSDDGFAPSFLAWKRGMER